MSAADLKPYLPDESPKAIIIWLDSDGFTKCKWVGITRENAASTLYQLADEIVKDLPPKVDKTGKYIQ